MDVAVCPNEQREYTGPNCSELLIWPHVHACQGKCVSKCVTDVFMFLPATTCEHSCPQCILADVNVYDCETGWGSHDEQWGGHPLLWTKAAAGTVIHPHIHLPHPLFHLFTSVPSLYFSLMLVWQPSSKRGSTGVNKRKRIKYLRSLSEKRKAWECVAVLRGCLCSMPLFPSIVLQIELLLFWQMCDCLCHSYDS